MKRVVFFLLASFLGACTQQQANSGSSENVNLNIQGEIVGETWVTDCDDDNYRYRWVFGTGAVGQYADHYAAGTNCAGEPDFSGGSSAKLVLGDMSDVVPGAQNMDVQGEHMSITPRTQQWVDFFKSKCPDLNWQVGLNTNVDGRNCITGEEKEYPLPPYPWKYLIFKIDGNNLQLWQTIMCFSIFPNPNPEPCYNGSTPELRTRTLDEDRIYHRY